MIKDAGQNWSIHVANHDATTTIILLQKPLKLDQANCATCSLTYNDKLPSYRLSQAFIIDASVSSCVFRANIDGPQALASRTSARSYFESTGFMKTVYKTIQIIDFFIIR